MALSNQVVTYPPSSDCFNFEDGVYFDIYLLAAVGWFLFFATTLPLLIVYWVLHKSRVRAEDELIKYKFSEQREVLKVPHDSNPRINTQSGGTSQSQPAMTPSVMSENSDPFLNPQRLTYRPPSAVPGPNDDKPRWQQVK